MSRTTRLTVKTTTLLDLRWLHQVFLVTTTTGIVSIARVEGRVGEEMSPAAGSEHLVTFTFFAGGRRTKMLLKLLLLLSFIISQRLVEVIAQIVTLLGGQLSMML